MGSWGCPHEWNGLCMRVKQIPCDPGMKGCALYGRFEFSNPAKNPPARNPATRAKEGDEPPGNHKPSSR